MPFNADVLGVILRFVYADDAPEVMEHKFYQGKSSLSYWNQFYFFLRAIDEALRAYVTTG